jgi:hypothetical protein
MKKELPFNGTKVYVGTRLKEVQEKLFELGYEWSGGEKFVIDTDAQFLYIGRAPIPSRKNIITYGCDYDYFKNDDKREVTADEILNYKHTQSIMFSGPITVPIEYAITFTIEQKKNGPKKKLPLPEFQPFDKVLVRVYDYEWQADIFRYSREKGEMWPYVCMSSDWNVCIPYNDMTKHLIGTMDESPYEEQ